MWYARKNGFPLAESFLFGSYRSASDASGDFILLDGFNGASRNPYHTFAILELRLGGYTLLNGYRNQIATRMDGLVEPQIAMNARLRHHDVIGSTAWAVAEVPDMPYCHWRRALVQRVGQYALILDDLSFRADSENMEVQIQWETEHTAKVLPDGQIDFTAPTEVPARRTAQGGQVRTADLVATRKSGRVTTMQWVGPVRQGISPLFLLPGWNPAGCEDEFAGLRADRRTRSRPGPAATGAGRGRNELAGRRRVRRGRGRPSLRQGPHAVRTAHRPFLGGRGRHELAGSGSARGCRMGLRRGRTGTGRSAGDPTATWPLGIACV